MWEYGNETATLLGPLSGKYGNETTTLLGPLCVGNETNGLLLYCT